MENSVSNYLTDATIAFVSMRNVKSTFMDNMDALCNMTMSGFAKYMANPDNVRSNGEAQEIAANLIAHLVYESRV